MFQTPSIHNQTWGTITLGDEIARPWNQVGSGSNTFRQLVSTSLFGFSPDEAMVNSFFLTPGDLPASGDYAPASSRYWYPTFTGSKSLMLKVPKCIMIATSPISRYNPLIIRWYFWTDKEKMEQMSSESTVQDIIFAASDVYETVVPTLPEKWSPPNWAPLPQYIPKQPLERISVLMARKV